MKIEFKVWAPTVAVSVLVSAGAAMWPSNAFALIAVTGVIFFIARNPDRLFYLTLVAATMALPAFVPTSIAIGPIGVKVYEPLLILSVVYAAVKYRGRVPAALSGMAALIVVWASIGLLAQHDPSKIIYDTRNLSMLWGACFVACRVAGTHVFGASLAWVKWILWISAGLSLLASVTALPLGGRVEEATLPVAGAGAGAAEGAVRLLTPATHLSLAVLCVLAVLVVTSKLRFRTVSSYAIPALIMVFISFSRNSLLGIGVAVLFGLLASRNVRSTAKTLASALAAVTTFWMLMASSSLLSTLPAGAWLNKQMEGFSGRVLGGLTSETLTVDSSAQFRFQQENLLIIPRIAENPFLGHGFGYAYKLPTGVAGTFNADFAPYYAHNFYLWLLAKAGLIGLALFLWFALVPAIRSLRGGSPAMVAAGGATLALLATSFVAPMPIGSPTGLILGALIGVCAATSEARQLPGGMTMARVPLSEQRTSRLQPANIS